MVRVGAKRGKEEVKKKPLGVYRVICMELDFDRTWTEMCNHLSTTKCEHECHLTK